MTLMPIFEPLSREAEVALFYFEEKGGIEYGVKAKFTN